MRSPYCDLLGLMERPGARAQKRKRLVMDQLIRDTSCTMSTASRLVRSMMKARFFVNSSCTVLRTAQPTTCGQQGKPCLVLGTL